METGLIHSVMGIATVRGMSLFKSLYVTKIGINFLISYYHPHYTKYYKFLFKIEAKYILRDVGEGGNLLLNKIANNHQMHLKSAKNVMMLASPF